MMFDKRKVFSQLFTKLKLGKMFRSFHIFTTDTPLHSELLQKVSQIAQMKCHPGLVIDGELSNIFTTT